MARRTVQTAPPDGLTVIYNHIITLAGTLNIPATDIGDGVYLDKSSRYITYTCRADPEFFADDAAQVDRYVVDINVFIPLTENYRSWSQSFRYKMEGLGFTDVTFEGQVYDAEDDKRHIMFNGVYDFYR